MALTAPQDAAVVIDREQRRGDDAEADFLAFHVAAGQAERAAARVVPSASAQ